MLSESIHQRWQVDIPFRQHLLPIKDSDGTRVSDRGICWIHAPTIPLSISYVLSIRGSENMHLYLWILKDLAWTQEWYYPSWIFGSLAVLWSLWLLLYALYDRATDEAFVRMGVLIWIFGNWWWITGEVHDWKYPEETPIYDERTTQTGYILNAGLCWLAVFYLFVRPFKLFHADNQEMLVRYDTTGLPPRLPWLFKTWRDYENMHVLFWMGKDCAWANNKAGMWIVFTAPTIAMAFEFMYCSFFRKHLLVDHAHYCAMFIWVTANAVWAGGELFNPGNKYYHCGCCAQSC